MVGFNDNMLNRRWSALRVGIAACCLFASAGCVQGPDYQRPTVQVPAAYRFDAVLDPQSAADLQSAWWRGFGDETLDKLVQESVENNRDLRIATARVDEFSAILVSTKAQGLPQVGYGLSAGRLRNPGASSANSSFSALLSASWEIDLWGRIRRETEAARANLLSTQEARRGVMLTLVASVIAGYVTLLDLDSRLEVAEATVAGRKKSVSLFQIRLDDGYISDFEMAQVLAEYEAAVTAIPDLKRLIAQQENALSVLVGRNPGPIERGRSLQGLGSPTVPVGLPAELLVRRPDVLGAEQTLVARNAQIGAVRALYFPQISLTGLGGFASTALKNLFTGAARTWSFTGDAIGPIYTGGGLEAASQQAEARRQQALSSYELTVQNAFRDVEDALVALQASRELVGSYERRVVILRRGVALSRERYDNGYSDYLDVLDTERSLFSAELSLVAARGDSQRALVDLYRALGGDWNDSTGLASMKGIQPAMGTEQPQ